MRTEPAAPSVEWIMTLFCARTRSRRWASEVAERGGGPHPLAAPDLTSRTPVDVCKGCYQEPDLHGARQRDAPFLSGAQVAPLLSCHARTSCVRFQLYGEADKVFLSSLKQLADQDHSEFPLRGAQRIIVANGCSRLRGGLRGRRPCGLAAMLLLRELGAALSGRVAVVDPSPPPERPTVHWSYWSQGPTLYDRFSVASWQNARVAQMPAELIAPYTLRLVRSTDVFAYISEELNTVSVDWLRASARSVERLENGTYEVVTDAGAVRAVWIFDSVPDI